MSAVPISQFIEELKLDDKNLLMEVLLHLQEHHQNNLEDLLLNLSDTDSTELLVKMFHYIITKPDFFITMPEICMVSLQDKNNFTNLEEYIKTSTLPLSQRYSLYWTAASLAVRNQDINFNDHSTTYLSLLESATKLLDLSCIKDLDISVDQKRVFIYTNQYLTQEHSPTKIANIWADACQEYGYTVIIISSTSSKFAFPTDISYNYRKSLAIGESTEIRENIFLIEIGGNLIYQDIYIKLIEAVHMNKNDTFLLVGDSCLAFDILPFDNKYVIPTVTPQNLITTTAHTYIFNKKVAVRNSFSEEMHHIVGPDDYTQSTHTDFLPPIIKENEEIQFAVIGNRLNSELEDSFWANIDTLLTQTTHFKLHIIGEIDKERISHHYHPYIIFAGFQTNLSDYLKKIHFYINPNRDGGGHSAALALKAGIPIITLPKGDVYEIILQRYSVKNLDEIYSFTQNYILDSAFKEKIDTINSHLFDKFNNSKELIKQIVRTILKIDEKQYE